MNKAAFLEYAYEEAAHAREGKRQVLVELRCNLADRRCRNALVGKVYATAVGFLAVALVSTKATAASEPGRKGMGLTAADTVPRYWLLGQSGANALAHPSPLSPRTPPSLVAAGDRPIRVHCAKHRQWIDCNSSVVYDAAEQANHTGRTSTLMVAS